MTFVRDAIGGFCVERGVARVKPGRDRGAGGWSDSQAKCPFPELGSFGNLQFQRLWKSSYGNAQRVRRWQSPGYLRGDLEIPLTVQMRAIRTMCLESHFHRRELALPALPLYARALDRRADLYSR